VSLRYEVRMKVPAESRLRVVARVEDVGIATAVAAGYREGAQRHIAALVYLFPWQREQVDVEVSVFDRDQQAVL